MTIPLSDQAFATIWDIPHHADEFSAKRVSSIEPAAQEMLAALESAVSNVAIRTNQLRRAAKLAIGLDALLSAYRHDPMAFSSHPVATARPRADEVEAQVRAAGGPKADTIAKAVAFVAATGRPVPGRDLLLQSADYLAARSLMDPREAALVRVMIQ